MKFPKRSGLPFELKLYYLSNRFVSFPIKYWWSELNVPNQIFDWYVEAEKSFSFFFIVRKISTHISSRTLPRSAQRLMGFYGVYWRLTTEKSDVNYYIFSFCSLSQPSYTAMKLALYSIYWNCWKIHHRAQGRRLKIHKRGRERERVDQWLNQYLNGKILPK